jgi:hypothetical protein
VQYLARLLDPTAWGSVPMSDPPPRPPKRSWGSHLFLGLQILAVLTLLGVTVYNTDRVRRLEQQNAALMERIPEWIPAKRSESRLEAVQCGAEVIADGKKRRCRNHTRYSNGRCRVHGGR